MFLSTSKKDVMKRRKKQQEIYVVIDVIKILEKILSFLLLIHKLWDNRGWKSTWERMYFRCLLGKHRHSIVTTYFNFLLFFLAKKKEKLHNIFFHFYQILKVFILPLYSTLWYPVEDFRTFFSFCENLCTMG